MVAEQGFQSTGVSNGQHLPLTFFHAHDRGLVHNMGEQLANISVARGKVSWRGRVAAESCTDVRLTEIFRDHPMYVLSG